MRVAIFFTPPPDHGLTAAAACWLGRDAHGGRALVPPPVEGFSATELALLTASPRRYGFHATMKAPFRLAGWRTLADVEAALEAFAARSRPVVIPALWVERIGAFFALTPRDANKGLQRLAGDVVRDFDGFRAPPLPEEIARRRPERLGAAERENLMRWGYPYVFESFRFHMTLTGEVPEARRTAMEGALEERFGALAAGPLPVDTLSIFVEAEEPGDFLVHMTAPLRGAAPSREVP